MQATFPPLVLASASAARRAVLAGAGLRFSVEPAAVDEATLKGAAHAGQATTAEAALLLAEAKARRVGERRPDALVIGADQILALEGEWFDKPADLPAARHQLLRLRGRSHMVCSGVVLWKDGTTVWRHVSSPILTMRPFSEKFLDAYLATEGEALLASVGAYRLEGIGIQLFAQVEGEHAAILGLPLLALLETLREYGVLML